LSLKTEILCRILAPYVDKLAESLLKADINFEEATLESIAEIICFKVELTVRQMTRELNTKMQNGELSTLRQLIRENPEAAQKASRYAAKKLKHRIRKLIEEELSRQQAYPKMNKPRGEKHEP
jgi:hypothetical protein